MTTDMWASLEKKFVSFSTYSKNIRKIFFYSKQSEIKKSHRNNLHQQCNPSKRKGFDNPSAIVVERGPSRGYPIS